MRLIPVAQHLASVLTQASPLPELEVPLAHALGLRLARDVVARFAVPPWDNSAMDGYAVRSADLPAGADEQPVTLRVVADLPAGTCDDPGLGPGEAARIMTGAPVPTSADTVVPLEHTDRTDPTAPLPETVTLLRPPTPGMHVRRAGEDRRVGDLVVAAGTSVTGAVAAALASTGHGTAWVRPRPRVGVITTGDELLQPGQTLRRGTIPDSNGLLLAGAVAEAGGELVHLARVPDDAAALVAQVEATAASADIVVLTGGVSQGAFDPVKQAFGASGPVTFATVAMQPGKPQAFGRWGSPERPGALVFGLPGNPVSVWVSFHVFVRPALLTLAGAPENLIHPEPARAVVEAGWRTPGGRDQYLPARIRTDRSGELVVSPAAALGSSSHLAASLARANGYAVLSAADQGGAAVVPGDVVDVVLTALELPHVD